MKYFINKFKLSKALLIAVLLMGSILLSSCDHFLDVVPNDTATIQKAFRMRNQAKKFLYTCYSYLPRYGSSGIATSHSHQLGTPSPSFSGSNEWWAPNVHLDNYAIGQFIATGQQSIVDPYLNYWEGRHGGSDMYEAIRKCNVFLKNIHEVGNMTTSDKKRWAAEVKFLKAYYYFYLLRMYGPIIMYKHNVSISAPKGKIDSYRAPVDSSFKYIIKLLNEVIHTPQLPARVNNRIENLGRITKSIAYAFKAKVEVYAASPLFNGNKDYSGFKNIKGQDLFDTKFDPAKWDSAAVACKQALDFLKAHNFQLYQFNPPVTSAGIDDTTKLKMTIRNSFALGYNKLNPGVIWYDTKNSGYEDFAQKFDIPRGLNPDDPQNKQAYGDQAPTLQYVKMFYTNHGLPLQEDKTWNYDQRFNVKTIQKDERFNLKEGYKTAQLNMHRGPRFYADLGFDGSIWYGNGRYQGGIKNYHVIKAKRGQINSIPTHENQFYSVTGYWVKKLLNWKTTIGKSPDHMSAQNYQFPIMRLSGIYLLYAEAKNEADGPGPQVYKYLNKVREHAGLHTVQKSWNKWSKNPNQYTTKAGLRKIIHHERGIELMFEGQRFWDVRRWKTAPQEANKPIRGWSINESSANKYYNPRTIFTPNFQFKDYFWPISEKEMERNPNLTQNPGW
jgi:hypothetical protein